MDTGLDSLYDPVVDFHIFGGLRFHDPYPRAENAGITDGGAGLYPEPLRLIGGGDAAACLCHDRRNAHGLSA